MGINWIASGNRKNTIWQNIMDTCTENLNTVVVWDPYVRIFHWGLVASIAVAAITGFLLGPYWIPVHVVGASLALGLILLRIIWGFSGGTYARFSSFVMGPLRVLGYLGDVLTGRETRYIGHNPLGGLMVLALLAVVIMLGFSGAAVLGASSKAGPLAFAIPYKDSGWLREIHETLALGLMLLIALHIAGVVFESRRQRENLARSMVTGIKERRDGDVISVPRAGLVSQSIRIGAIWLGGAVLIAGLSFLPVPRPPVAEYDPLVAEECSACHMLYHPSLLPAKDWEHITATLADHYGEDASLDDESTAKIRDWLMANAAETADTRAANVFQLNPAGGIKSLTDTAFWRARHRGLSDAIFKSKAVRARSNCVACHEDAESGWFNPFQVEIP